jgi:microcystin-dependent protein
VPVKLTDKVYTESGAPVQGAVAQAILTNGTTTAITATDTTDTNGVWAFDSSIAGHQPDLADPGVGYWYDVRISSGMQYRLRYGAIKSMMSMVYLAQTIVIAAGQQLDTSVAAFRMPARTTDPVSPAAGQVAFRTDTKALRIHDGTAWNSIGVPVGSLVLFGSVTAPPGWALCDGSLLNRVTFATLFAVIGTTYGAGDGSTTFAVPDLRSRVPMGSGTGTGLTARALGAVGGEETHVLAGTEVGAHNHGLVDPQHSHGITDAAHSHVGNNHNHPVTDANHGHTFGNGPMITTNVRADSGSQYNVFMTGGGGQSSSSNPTGISTTGQVAQGVQPSYTGIPAATGAALTNASVGASPAAAGHNVVQPFLVMAYIIKTQ